jgi:hypothetical protein
MKQALYFAVINMLCLSPHSRIGLYIGLAYEVRYRPFPALDQFL